MSRYESKREWQRKQRHHFRQANGYSTTSYYAVGGLRQQVLERDNYRCVRCGMTDQEHKEQWGRPITIDHKDRNRRCNELDNLQTLCLSCHGRQDISPHWIIPRVPVYKSEILVARQQGSTYQSIADHLGFSIASIWKWCRRWENNIQIGGGRI